MKRLWQTAVVVAAILCAPIATGDEATQGTSAKPKGPRIVILPLQIDPKLSDESYSSAATFARAALIGAFRERDFDVVSSVQVQALADSKSINLSDGSSWNPGAFRQLGDPFKSKYVLAVRLTALKEAMPSEQTEALSAEATCEGFLFDLAKSDYVFLDKLGQANVAMNPEKGKELKPAVVTLQAVADCVRKVVQEFLSKFPKPKKKK